MLHSSTRWRKPAHALLLTTLTLGLALLAGASEARQLNPGSTVNLQAVINGQYVSAENAGVSALLADRPAAQTWETFTVVDAGNGNIALESLINGKYVCADNQGTSPLIANRTAVGSWETFTEVDAGNGNIGLKAMANGKYVCADNAGSSPLIANRTAVGAWESFRVNAGAVSGGTANAKVYIGELNHWSDLNNNPNQWNFVRANADGFYANFIQLLPGAVGDPNALCQGTAAVMTHKNVIFESDSRYTGLGGFPNGGQFTLATEAQEMDELINAGFNITYTSLNYGVDGPKENQCRTYRGSRPCLAQSGPWTYGGNGDIANSPSSEADIRNSDGASSDGPLDLWASNNGGMQLGSVTMVQYARNQGKISLVMVDPGDMDPSQWFSTVQSCVRVQENNNARPDIWADYDYKTAVPALPETNGDGTPANTITGAAFWLIHHTTDPAHWARLTLPETPGLHPHGLSYCSVPTTLPASVRLAKAQTGATPLETTEADLYVPVTHVANGTYSATRTIDLALTNESKWLDLSPVLSADVNDPGHHWNIAFRLNGKDITKEMAQQNGFAFIKDQRLWPTVSKHLQMVLTYKTPTALGTALHPIDVKIAMIASPTRRDKINETLTIHGSTADKAAQLASAAIAH